MFNTHNLNGARYVQVREDTLMGDVIAIWYGGTLFTIICAVTGMELNCWHTMEVPEDWREAHSVMTLHFDTLEDEAREEENA